MKKNSFFGYLIVNYVENRLPIYKVEKYRYLLDFLLVLHKKVYNLEQISTSFSLNGDKILGDI